MRPDILPTLVNGPEGDPSLYANFKYERRALLFDMGSLHALSARSILKITHAFISHAHVDHFIGFDQILRLHLGREKTLTLYGPPGMASHVEARLRGYSWNLVDNYPYDFRLMVYEVGEGTPLQAAFFRCQERFERRPRSGLEALTDRGVILDEPGLQVRAALLEHDIPSLAYVLEKKKHINVDKVRLEAMGLAVGAWIRVLKELVVSGAPEDTLISVKTAEGLDSESRKMTLGDLYNSILHISRGQKIAYVTDAAYTPQNREKILALVKGADIFFCEAAFSEQDLPRARQRRHLTAHQAGLLAREAGAERLVIFHFSPRYHDQLNLLYDEASLAFGKEVSWRK